MFSYKPLFRTMLENDVKKTDLRNDLNLSPAIVAKFAKNEYVSMDVLGKLCCYFNCNIDEIIEYKNEKAPL